MSVFIQTVERDDSQRQKSGFGKMKERGGVQGGKESKGREADMVTGKTDEVITVLCYTNLLRRRVAQPNKTRT